MPPLTATNWLFLIPFLPLAGAIVNGFFGRRLPRSLVGPIACAGPVIAFVLSALWFFDVVREGAQPNWIADWIEVGLDVPFAFVLDNLSGVMALVVTGVGSLIHIYSIGYMGKDPGYARYFAYLNLFMSAMLILVLADNVILLFLGWEGVGLCSYLLIGFWYEDEANARAGKKAFVVNRIGDFCFAIGMFLIFVTFGSFNFGEINRQIADPTGQVSQDAVFWITLLLFIGATGKSAQIPLYVWLPDAMAGPTPVSALIHAATMVTSGVYLVARLGPLYTASPAVLGLIATVGAITALVAGFIALAQYDIKKVLAYSTVSQLGYMFLAAGLGAYGIAVFHLVTHAFFKGLLFLGSGAVIHSLHHEQDMRRMGGLRKHLPITFVLMGVGTLAIAGCPLLAGFYSKDAILHQTMVSDKLLWVLGAITAVLTSFYMFRLMALTFFGECKYGQESAAHGHDAPTASADLLETDHGSHGHSGPITESPKVMLVPMAVLALLSVFGGMGFHGLPNFLDPKTPLHGMFHELATADGWIGMGLFGCGLAGAWLLYGRKAEIRIAFTQRTHVGRALWKLSNGKLFVDELYAALIVKPLDFMSQMLYFVVDRLLVDGVLVGGSGFVTRSVGSLLRQLQTGRVSTYAGWYVGGALAILLVVLMVIRGQ